MRAVRIHGKEDIRVEQIDKPEPGPGQVRIRVAYTGICGSDLHYYYEGRVRENVVREPMAPGHEPSGVIDLDPSGTWPAGTPVTMHPAILGQPQPGLEGLQHMWPGGGYLGSAAVLPHFQGSMVEYILIKKEMVRPLPEGLPLRRAALAEPLAVALHALEQSGGVEGQNVLVSGSGPIGLCVIAALRASGAAKITATDMLPGPLSRARALGVDHVIDISSEQIPQNTYDVVFECAGVVPAVNSAIKAVRIAGTLVQVGLLPAGELPIEIAPLISKECTLKTSFRFNDEIGRAVEMLAANDYFDAIVTHVIPADRVEEAFAVAKNSEESGKVLVDLWYEEEAK